MYMCYFRYERKTFGIHFAILIEKFGVCFIKNHVDWFQTRVFGPLSLSLSQICFFPNCIISTVLSKKRVSIKTLVVSTTSYRAELILVMWYGSWILFGNRISYRRSSLVGARLQWLTITFHVVLTLWWWLLLLLLL